MRGKFECKYMFGGEVSYYTITLCTLTTQHQELHWCQPVILEHDMLETVGATIINFIIHFYTKYINITETRTDTQYWSGPSKI